jgi:NAD+ synthase
MRQLDFKSIRKYLLKSLADEIKEKGFKKGVVGVSGGLDSTVVATLLSLSLDRENTIGVVMPYDGTREEDTKDAIAVLENLGVKAYRIDISPMVDDYFKNFPLADRIRRGNKMARERMSILYDISALENALVIGTGNKTEYNLGYFTLFGDSACAIDPIGDLYKCEVRQFANHIGVPEKIIKKTPSAGLWKEQTDEGELGYGYDEIDNLLYHIVDLKYSKKKLLEMGFKEKFIDDILGRIKNTEFKRTPPFIISIPEQVKYVHKY